MGLLVGKDSLILRSYFKEMCKLRGISVGYQYITKKEMTIHSEENNTYSMPIRIDILFDENPSIDTLTKYGWLSELGEQQPVIANFSYDTPYLRVGCRVTIEASGGSLRPRVFRISKMANDLEYPDSFICALVPVYDQLPQKNQYTLVNTEKISQEESKRTSKDQSSKYITDNYSIDTTPKEYTEWENKYNFINENNSPYSG